MATMRLMLSEIDLPAGEVTYAPGGTLGPRRQHDIQLVLIHAGGARITVDDGPPAPLAAGWVRLLLPGHRETFAFDRERPTRHSWVQGRPADPGLLPRLAALAPQLRCSAELGSLIGAAVAAARAPLPTARPLAAALGGAALWRYAGEAEAGTHDGDVVEQARQVLHARLGDPALDLAQVARAVHVTPAHLVRRFRAQLGITPMAYLWGRRVAAGIELLTGTGLPVGTIAARSGFKTVHHFSRRVRAEAGMPPTELRRVRWDS